MHFPEALMQSLCLGDGEWVKLQLFESLACLDVVGTFRCCCWHVLLLLECFVVVDMISCNPRPLSNFSEKSTTNELT